MCGVYDYVVIKPGKKEFYVAFETRNGKPQLANSLYLDFAVN